MDGGVRARMFFCCHLNAKLHSNEVWMVKCQVKLISAANGSTRFKLVLNLDTFLTSATPAFFRDLHYHPHPREKFICFKTPCKYRPIHDIPLSFRAPCYL
jgi:hypothetical protein